MVAKITYLDKMNTWIVKEDVYMMQILVNIALKTSLFSLIKVTPIKWERKRNTTTW